MEQKKKEHSYSELQREIDKLITKFGMTKAITIVHHLSGEPRSVKNEKQKVQLLVTFITTESRRLFGCEVSVTDHENTKECLDARMTTYHLIKTYTDLSYSQIGKRFGQSKRAVIHHHNKCKDVLSIPQFHKSFMSTYHLLERNVIQFLAKIN
ncbi:MAG: hypothetical protein CL613_11255 [Aquimarina sp.]|nr:hypothetical protein [Aquimarina sp.]